MHDYNIDLLLFITKALGVKNSSLYCIRVVLLIIDFTLYIIILLYKWIIIINFTMLNIILCIIIVILNIFCVIIQFLDNGNDC